MEESFSALILLNLHVLKEEKMYICRMAKHSYQKILDSSQPYSTLFFFPLH